MESSDRHADSASGLPDDVRVASDVGERRTRPWLAASQVLDHELLDRSGRRAGRVDDLLFDVVTAGGDDTAPRLVLRALLSGPLARPFPRPLRTLARLVYRLVGVANPRPCRIDWAHVRVIDVFVHLDVDRDAAGLRLVDGACARLLRAIPGAERNPAA